MVKGGAIIGGMTTRRRLERAAVIEAAVDLLDDEGAAALSMPRLAQRLGVSPMALYRHVEDRADLEYALTETVLHDIVADAADDDWEHGIEQWMRGVRDRWRRHPWLGKLIGTRTELSPPWMDMLQQLAALLAAAGLPPGLAASEFVKISRLTTGVVTFEIAAPLPHPAGAKLLAHMPGEATPVRAIFEALQRYGDDDFFDDLIADTIERLHRHRAAGQS